MSSKFVKTVEGPFRKRPELDRPGKFRLAVTGLPVTSVVTKDPLAGQTVNLVGGLGYKLMRRTPFKPLARIAGLGPLERLHDDVVLELVGAETQPKLRITLTDWNRLTRSELSQLVFKLRSLPDIKAPPAPAQTALDVLETELFIPPAGNPSAAAAPESPRQRGQRLLVRWTEDGTLVPSQELAEAWGMTRQALDARVGNGQLFKVTVAGRAWYPGVFKDLMVDQVAKVCEAFGPAEGMDHLMFWLREHGALRGKTPAQALDVPELGLAAVTRLAQALRQERA